jgi:hypothetical protein
MKRLSQSRVRRLVPGPGVVIGTIALMVALGGTAAANLPGNNTVVSGDIVNGDVRAVDIGANAVGASEFKATFTQGNGVVVPAGAPGGATATCPAGMQIVSGGFNWDLSVAGVNVTSMELNTAAQAVTVFGFNGTASNRTLSARAYCIP